mgnify:CR=1 FL=1
MCLLFNDERGNVITKLSFMADQLLIGARFVSTVSVLDFAIEALASI